MGKTFRRGGSERGYYSPGKSIRDKRQKGGTNRSTWADESNNYDDFQNNKKDESLIEQQKKMDGTEIEREPEMLEFDDFSEVDYDLDYTVQY